MDKIVKYILKKKAKKITESDFIQKEQFNCFQHKLLSNVTKKSALPKIHFYQILRRWFGLEGKHLTK